MNETSKKSLAQKVLLDCLKRYGIIYIVLAVMTAINLAVFALYGLAMEPFFYALICTVVFAIVLFIVMFVIEMKKAARRDQLKSAIMSEWNNLGEASTYEEADYQEMVKVLGTQIDKMMQEYMSAQNDTIDYYTTWVHQIKTPISVLRMRIGNEDNESNRALRAELFRIEQYVDMVLQYIRLGSETNDLVVEEYSLSELVKDAIHRHSEQLIMRKLKLEYEPSEVKVVTDKKWVACILDQLFSNAVKYTQSGGIKIRITDDRKIIFSDTGIGIAAEDVPRIFEKGFTGMNGRLGKKSSGLGLYLSKMAADKIAATITCESAPGEGTTFIITFSEKINIY